MSTLCLLFIFRLNFKNEKQHNLLILLTIHSMPESTYLGSEEKSYALDEEPEVRGMLSMYSDLSILFWPPSRGL